MITNFDVVKLDLFTVFLVILLLRIIILLIGIKKVRPNYWNGLLNMLF